MATNGNMKTTEKGMAYWKKRLLVLRESEQNRSIEFINALESQYQQAIKETEKDIAVFYSRLAKNNEISTTAAKKYLTTAELPGFRMTLEEYQDMAAQINLPDEYKRMLENASLKYRVSRLDAAKLQMQHHATVLMKTQMDALDYHLQNTYMRSFTRGAFEISKGAGVTLPDWGIDIDRLRTIVRKPWGIDGISFSDRIWGDHRPRLVTNLQQSLSQMVARGDGPDKAIKEIRREFGVSQKAARRIVQTEVSFIAEQAKLDIYKDLDVNEYEFTSSLSERTCPICGALDGMHWKISEKEVGVNFPPMHPNCTICTTVPFIDPEDLAGDTRAAKDENGKTVYIPANMKYDEWKKLYLKGGKKGDTIPPPDTEGFNREKKAFWEQVERINKLREV